MQMWQPLKSFGIILQSLTNSESNSSYVFPGLNGVWSWEVIQIVAPDGSNSDFMSNFSHKGSLLGQAEGKNWGSYKEEMQENQV